MVGTLLQLQVARIREKCYIYFFCSYTRTHYLRWAQDGTVSLQPWPSPSRSFHQKKQGLVEWSSTVCMTWKPKSSAAASPENINTFCGFTTDLPRPFPVLVSLHSLLNSFQVRWYEGVVGLWTTRFSFKPCAFVGLSWSFKLLSWVKKNSEKV